MKYLIKALAVVLLFNSGALYSGVCDDYPYSHGEIDIITNTEEEIKIVATAEEEVLFNDLDLRIEAQDIAKEAAKVVMASFMQEEISNYCQTDTQKASNVKFSSENPETKQVEIEKTKVRLCTMSSNTSALLRGVDKVDGCVQMNDQPRKVVVTVGIKTENILAAERMASQINESIERSNTPKGEICVKDPNNPEDCVESGEEESKGMPLNKDNDKKGGEKLKKF
jgi:transcriptional regulator of met regulon